ncbi:hypothetical protein POVWA2_050000 [Plasmodium ovale wallikeri]|uniref:Uncharacterized protein n=1 Tax=Plasmodium ovale wallikeri TaxID=864142 RepID=A0A1A8ZNM5_PLAOA|nr:hypothetical protein POVWA1_001410 [Plasmodium ovale wallikeri]SBT45466.1 hypothetical protein POVWA2_050000 [Plasmodium ovale wallikeri]
MPQEKQKSCDRTNCIFARWINECGLSHAFWTFNRAKLHMNDVHRLEREGNGIMSSDKRYKLATKCENKHTYTNAQKSVPIAHVRVYAPEHAVFSFSCKKKKKKKGGNGRVKKF